ncbi:MAG: hypothetical protein LBH42_07320 [Treponema sp.]|jgi:hypothetical protein|nr:hypothetical protein [Treponema sp.]
MAQDGMFQGKMDPEIAALLGTAVQNDSEEAVPDYAHLFNESEGDSEETQSESEEPDLTHATFPEITKRMEETPHNGFDDPNYYKTALSGEGDISQRVHGILQKFLNAKDPKDKGVFRQQLIPAYWEFLTSVARKAPGKILEPKKYLLRFGLLHPTFLDADIRKFFAKIVVDNYLSQPVYYLDEWFKGVGTGVIKSSSTDEARVPKSNNAIKYQQLLEKAQGKLDGAKVMLKTKDRERLDTEKNLLVLISQIADHYPVPGLPDISSCYTDAQKRIFGDAQNLMKVLLKADHDQEVYIRDYQQSDADVKGLQVKIEEAGAVEVDVHAVDAEFGTVRQMAKMTIGRQGNHFPILTGEYFRCMANDVGYRENVIATLAWIESVDPEAYCRIYKNRLNRIVPYVILIPSYGDVGMCWEPFDRHNRATSRGRIAVPMYPKNLHYAVLWAVGDLRWQVAKEKASFYWMEEGITGNYYQWFTKMKLKGDLKESFIQDYILWMTKESEGTQKLDKELRGAFWRHIPFSQPIKEKLKTRNFVYQELYQRDLNRAMSDGY